MASCSQGIRPPCAAPPLFSCSARGIPVPSACPPFWDNRLLSPGVEGDCLSPPCAEDDALLSSCTEEEEDALPLHVLQRGYCPLVQRRTHPQPALLVNCLPLVQRRTHPPQHALLLMGYCLLQLQQRRTRHPQCALLRCAPTREMPLCHMAGPLGTKGCWGRFHWCCCGLIE
jgi:hypothetical protein